MSPTQSGFNLGALFPVLGTKALYAATGMPVLLVKQHVKDALEVANYPTIIDRCITPVFRVRQLNYARAMSSGSPTLATSAHTLAGLNKPSPVLRDLGVEQVPVLVPGTGRRWHRFSTAKRRGPGGALRCPSTAPRQKEGDRK